MTNPLVGVCLVGETNNDASHVLGVVHLPASSRDQNLSEFRNALTATLSSSFNKRFMFLTSHGWEISEMMEDKVKLSDVISDEGVIKVRIAYHKPKYGITIEGQSDTPVGFLFCNPEISIMKLREEIKQQLPTLYYFLSTVHFAFLDLNGWPISKQQEGLLTLFEVASFHVVRIRCAKSLASSQGPNPLSTLPITNSSIEGSTVVSGTQFDPASSLLQPITELMECVDSSVVNQSLTAPDFDSLHRSSVQSSFEILISYVHNEAGSYALLLKKALENLGYSVFLDIHCIQGGVDWQDTLNDAITNCSLFVPLITLQYGQTLWTNREVKLADVLGKIIIPVNFLSSWPPKCLAIQFATTQFVAGIKDQSLKGTPEDVDHDIVVAVASDISDRFSLEQSTTQDVVVSMDEENGGDSVPDTKVLARQDTQPVVDEASSTGSTASLCTSSSPSLLLMNRKKSTIRSYASSLPTGVDASFRQSITQSREGKPLITICCAPQQRDFVDSLVNDLKAKGYETWCSGDEECDRLVFQQKADEAGVVIFILSEEFASNTFCEQQVYYCEQRKRIIPLIYKPMQLPNWMAMLIGTSTFIDCRSQNYQSTLLDRIESSFNPQQAEVEFKQASKEKVELANMCTKLSEQLPKGKHVYISGGTQFFSKCGEQICKELGKKLAEDQEIVLVTGGFYGIGETVARSFYEERIRRNKLPGVCHVVAVRDKQDKSNQTRQNPDGTFAKIPYGDTLFFGNSVRQREMLTPKVIDLCILVEGGPGAAFEAQQFTWNGNRVIPVKVTGGAASGLFNIPPTVLLKPPNVKESDWSILSDSTASPSDVGSALYRIVQAVKNPILSSRSRCGSIGDNTKSKRRVSIHRSDTLPPGDSSQDTNIGPMKRAFSEKDAGIKKQRAIVL